MSTLKVINLQHPSYANNNVVLDANGNMTCTGTVVGGSSLGMRNRIINGAFDIWQRGTSFTGNAIYTADRWWFVNDAVGASSVTQVNISTLGLGATYCLRAERTSGTNRWVVGTQLETTTLNQCRGKSITLSFKMRKGSALSSDVTVTIGSSSTEAKFGSVVDGGNLTVTNASLNTSTFTTFSTTITIPSATAALGIKLEFSATQAGASGAYFDITDVQLEEGSVSTPFERRQYGLELALCQRYYWKSYGQSTVPGTATLVGINGLITATTSSSAILFNWDFPVTMRTAPTLTIYSAAGTAGNITTNGSWTTSGTDRAVSFSGTSETHAYVTGASGGLDGYYAMCHLVAAAEL